MSMGLDLVRLSVKVQKGIKPTFYLSNTLKIVARFILDAYGMDAWVLPFRAILLQLLWMGSSRFWASLKEASFL